MKGSYTSDEQKELFPKKQNIIKRFNKEKEGKLPIYSVSSNHFPFAAEP